MKLIQKLKNLKKQKVKIETKDTKIYEGTVVKVDGQMNFKLRGVTLKYKKTASNYDEVIVRGSLIRYVLFDDNFNLML